MGIVGSVRSFRPEDAPVEGYRYTLIARAFYVEADVTFTLGDGVVERATVTAIDADGFTFVPEGDTDARRARWAEALYPAAFIYRRLNDERPSGSWPCVHCRRGDHLPCPAPDGGLALCCCDDTPSLLFLECVELMEELGSPLQGFSEAMANARLRGWPGRR